jgi:hypothetical protein
MEIIIFYSWQSDKPSKNNKNFIQSATEKAIKRIHKDANLKFEPSLDRDTKNVPGSPEIVRTILGKIEKSHIFLCDVTIIADEKRPIPNPNVLIELGYAAAKMGWERIICVMNEQHGTPEALPFDLRHRRWPITYNISSDVSSEERSKTREILSKEIERAIRDVVQSGILTSTINPKDRRVAEKFSNSLTWVFVGINIFASENNQALGINIFNEDHEDMIGSNYPDPKLFDSLIDAFKTKSLLAPSNRKHGDHVLSWVEAFILTFDEVAKKCDKILDQYSDRDESLISLVDEVHNRASTLSSMLRIMFSEEKFQGIYDSGLPESHIEFYRYFFLTLLKSRRVIRRFGGE